MASDRFFSLLHGPDLAVDFGHDAAAALAYVAEHADELLDADVVLCVWGPSGDCEVALVDARKGEGA